MFVHEAIAQEIREHGVEVVFGLLGNDTEKLAAELLRLGVAFCPAHHEAQAVDMATGYSRASGRLCVAVLNRGPGLTNAINALTLVAKSRSRVLAVCGDASTRLAKRRDAARIDAKHVDQAMLCSSVGAILVRPISADTVVADTRAALELATRGGAVVLAVPDDIIGSGTYGQPGSGAGKGVEAGAGAASVEFPSPVKPPTPKAEEVSIVADLLETGWAASRPVILAGHGAFLAGAGPALQRLGELTGAVLATTLVARSLFEGDPYNVGICGSFASPIASDLIASSDCVLCFGASLNDHTTYGKTIFSHARVIQVDCQETAFGLFMEPEVAMHCDAAAAATALVEELERRGHHAVGLRTPEIRNRLADPWPGLRDQSAPGVVDPRGLIIELDRILPRKRTVVMDGGMFMFYGCAHLSAERPDSHSIDREPIPNFITTGASGSIGHGLGVAIGASMARPDRITVLNVGDAGFMMSMNDLGTAVNHRLPLVIIVSNDGAWGSEMHRLREEGLPDDVARVPAPSFAALASAMGAEGCTISCLDDLSRIADRLKRTDLGPILLDCHINPDVRSDRD